MKAAPTFENITSLRSKKSSHTNDEASLKRIAEATDTNAVYRGAFRSQPPNNNMSMAADRCATKQGYITGKRFRSNIKADTMNMEEKEEVRYQKYSSISHNEKKSTEDCRLQREGH